MQELIPMDDMGIFASKNDVVLVDSRWVAKAFEKEHKNVLKNIDDILAPESGYSEEFGRLNFQPTSYKDSWNRKQRCYAITRDGFCLLVMGFTGKKAARFKEAYINRFNQMEEQLKNLVSARIEFPLLMEQVRLAHEAPKPYHYSNEADMLNRIVLGMTASKFREKHALKKDERIRPHLRPDQIAMLDFLQTMDMGLVLGVPDFQQRKALLQSAAFNAVGKYGTTRESISFPALGNESSETEENT